MRGKHIWLVGASEGIGAAVARKLASEGASLTLSARQHDKLTALVASLPGSGHAAVAVDVTSPESIASAARDALSRHGGVDMLIYNAGTYEPMEATNIKLNSALRMMDINFTGGLRVVAEILPAMLARGSGHVALVGSVAAYRGLPAAIGYGASKAAIRHLAENLKADLATTKLKVQLISPGFVKTRLTDKNSFRMPFMITAERAADYIVAGLASPRFEIHFPKRFTYIMKTLALLPYGLYFRMLRLINLT